MNIHLVFFMEIRRLGNRNLMKTAINTGRLAVK